MIFSYKNALQRVSTYFHAKSMARDNPLRMPPFSLLLDDKSSNRYRNYAVPDNGATVSQEIIAELVATFESHDRIPRLEYLPALAPKLERELVAVGFTREAELAMLCCTSDTYKPPSPPIGTTCELAVSAGDLFDAADVQNAAYGEGPATVTDVDRLRSMITFGGLVAVARRADGLPVGSCLVAAPIDGIAEIAAVGVLENERGKGVGGAVSGFLTHQALQRGIDLPFLMAAHQAEVRMYQRIGFVVFGAMLHIARGGIDNDLRR